MKTGKTLKLAGALAASLALLAVLAGCGQSSKPSSQKDSTSNTPAKSTSQTSPSTQASPSPASSSSSSTPGSSFASSASTGSSASTSTASSTPSASSSSADSTTTSTQAMPSNEVLYLLAYIKYRGGLEAITPSDLIVDEYMIGTQKGTVLTSFPTGLPTLQMTVDGERVEVIGRPSPNSGSDERYSVKAVYNANSLVSEYYSTPAQQAEVNSLLQEGERHNLLDVLAFMHSTLWINGGTNFQRYQFGLFGDLLTDGGTDVYSLVAIKGSEVVLCINSKAGASYPWHHQYYYFNAQSLLDKYYSTPAQKSQVNEYISFGTKNGSWE